MLKYKDGNLTPDVIAGDFATDKFNFIYINYNKSSGLKVKKDILLKDLPVDEKDLSNYYRIYIFNGEKMIVYTHIDKKSYTCETVEKNIFDDKSVIEKTAYLDKNRAGYNKIKYITGITSDSGDEQIMYTGLE